MTALARPGKVLCVGLNYRDHAEEAGKPIPDEPMIFAKLSTSFIGHGEPIVLPGISSCIDFEAELGVVIGANAKGVPANRVGDVVAGYVCFNDVTARDLQRQDGQWTRSKSFDTFGPAGPRVVPASDVGDPHDLGIICRINGDVVQSGSTANMIFSVEEIVAYISRGITLEAGDLIATGTPGGIGAWHEPPRWLVAGDVVEVEIDRVGVLSNPVSRCVETRPEDADRKEEDDALIQRPLQRQ